MVSKTTDMHNEDYYKDGNVWVVITCPKCKKVNPGNKINEGVCHYCGWNPKGEDNEAD